MTIHDYEYYHNSYIVSISVHKYHDQRKMNMQSSSIINVRLPLYSDFMKFLSHFFYKILHEITIQIVRQSTILFMNSLKLSQ